MDDEYNELKREIIKKVSVKVSEFMGQIIEETQNKIEEYGFDPAFFSYGVEVKFFYEGEELILKRFEEEVEI